MDLERLAWPPDRLADAIEALAARSGLPVESRPAGSTVAEARVPAGGDHLGRAIEATTAWLGLESEPVICTYAEMERVVLSAAPAIARLPGTNGLLALAGRRRGKVVVLRPDLRQEAVPAEELRALLCAPAASPFEGEVDLWLAAMEVQGARKNRARAAILGERLRDARIGGVWLLRAPPGSSFIAQARLDGHVRRLVTLVLLHVAQYGVWFAAWVTVGRGAFQGRLDREWLAAWALLLILGVPLRLVGTWIQGRFALGLGALLKRRLLEGSLRIDHDVIRHQGAGQLLGRAIEAGAVQGLALSAGFHALFGVIELLFSVFVLAAGPGGGVSAALAVGWVGVTLALAWRSYRLRLRWTDLRQQITNDLVEQMVGHRTRLAQQAPEHWHDGEDEDLDRYVQASSAMDRTAMLLVASPRGWLLVSLAALVPAFVAGAPSLSIAVGLGGVLLAGMALTKMSTGLQQLIGAGIAWRQVEPLYRAAARGRKAGSPALSLAPPVPGAPIVDAADLVFGYSGRIDPVLAGTSLRIGPADRILLEGPSGGGKSTLAAVLTGMREPASGLLLSGGLDRRTLGESGWRRRIVSAPQFHDNHVLTETFAFNLLMGRRWPPGPEDMRDAEEICDSLGLGDLVRRMPAGLGQMVGDSGWRLSHGEKSRLYIARALLQGASLVILDESFAALDPETLRRCLRCVLDRAPALLVVAHP